MQYEFKLTHYIYMTSDKKSWDTEMSRRPIF